MKSLPCLFRGGSAGLFRGLYYKIPCEVIGDAVSPAKVDQATRGGYLAGIRIGAEGLENF